MFSAVLQQHNLPRAVECILHSAAVAILLKSTELTALPALCLHCQLAWASLAWRQWSVVRQVWPKTSALCDRARTVLTTWHTGLIPNMISVLPMACYWSTEQFWTLQLCQIGPKLHLTLASCRWQRQIEFDSGEHNTSSQKYFHILQQFMLQQLSQMWYLFTERIYPAISTSPCRRELRHTSLLLFQTATGCFLLMSPSCTHRDHTLPVQQPCPMPDFVDLCKVSILRQVSRG